MPISSTLVPIQDVFGTNIYQIPDYQRGYAWEETQIKDLLEDLENVENGKTHYTGTMVIVKNGEKRQAGESFAVYDVIDGQQRLSTIVILLHCLHEEFEEIDKKAIGEDKIEEYGEPMEISQNICDKYIITGNLYRLILNEDSNCYFINHIITDARSEGINKTENRSQENLKNAKHVIKSYFHDKRGFFNDDEAFFEYLSDLKLKITNSLIVNKYEVESDAEAGVIFEVMNDRGKPLSQADKIKNYLIYLAYKIENTELARMINNYWGTIFRNLMASKRSNDDDFLRYHWITYTNEYKEYDIHRRIKKEIRLKDENGLRIEDDELEKKVRDYITDIKEASNIFLELNQPDNGNAFSDDTYRNFSQINEIKDTISKFHRLRNIATFYPLFMSARRVFKDKPQYFLDILRLSEIFTFRVYIIGNRRSNTKQATFYRLAFKLHELRHDAESNKDEKFSETINEIVGAISWHGADDYFKENLQNSRLYNDIQSHEIKYFFFELEKYKAKELNEEFGLNWKDIEKKAQIEHIWPQKPRGFDHWSEEEKEEHSKHVHKLGNLTITGWNQTLSNKDFWSEEEFDTKRPIYGKSNLRVQRELEKYNKWGVDQIIKRERELVDFALEKWKYDNEWIAKTIE
jgi:hypothetical protein